MTDPIQREPPEITVQEWRSSAASDGTPRCPNCRRFLGIRLGLKNSMDRWLCDTCGKFEKVPA